MSENGILELGAAYRVRIPRTTPVLSPFYDIEMGGLQAWIDDSYEKTVKLPAHFRLALYEIKAAEGYRSWDVYFPTKGEATLFWLRWSDGWQP